MPSVLWRCWLGGRKSIRPVKNWVVGCWHGYLSGVRCKLAYGQLISLPLTVSCFIKIQIGFTFLVPAHLGSPGKRAVKRACVCVCVCGECMLFVVLDLVFFHSKSRDSLGIVSPKWPVLCWMGCKTATQSISEHLNGSSCFFWCEGYHKCKSRSAHGKGNFPWW